jgi:hypothetical protein
MKKLTALASLALCLVPLASFAGPMQKKMSSPTLYVCSKCHMKFSAAEAKKDHYKDSMDGGTLVAVKTANAKPSAKKPAPSMNSMGM